MIIILLLFYVQAGHIYSGGLTITNPIATKALQFRLQFALENGLDADEYLKIQFPFPLNIGSIQAKLQTITTSSDGQFGDWDLGQLGEDNTINFEDLADAQSQGNTDNIYYFTFNQIIRPKTWYVIIIYSNNPSVQTPGYKNPVKFWSVSSMHSQSIVYDENPAFAQMALQALPPQSLKLDLSYEPAKIGLSQLVTITITPTVSIGQKSQFIIEIDSNYQFLMMDEIAECEISSGCSCTITSSNIMSIQCSIDLAKEKLSSTITTKIENSKILFSATQSTPVTVYSTVGNGYLEYGIKKDQIKLTKLSLTVDIFLLWGVPMDDQLITLYKPATGSVGYPFNSVKVQFSLTSPTPASEQLITITTGDADAVLQASIAHNLGSSVKCYFRKTEQQIYCKHVTSLKDNFNYFVTFKCAFTSTATSTQTNFARVTIKSVTRDTKPYKTYVLAGPTGKNLKVQTSQEFVDPAAQGLTNWGYNFVAFGDSTATFATAYSIANTRTVGLKVGSQRIIFYLKVLPNQMCSSSYSYCSAGQQPELFMKVLFNKKNIKYDEATISLEQSSACTQCTSSLKQYNDNDVYLSMKCSKNYNSCTQLLNGGKGFGFIAEIQKYPSLYPSETLLDFIVAFYQAPTGSSESMATLVSQQLIHGYVIGTDSKTLSASYVNYITAGSGAGTITGQNKGEKIPTFLRLLGQVTQSNEHVGIFIDGSVETVLVDSMQLQEENDDLGTSTTSKKLCSIDNCIWYGHRGTGTTHTYSDIYSNQRMILLKDFSGSTAFDLIVGLRNYGIKPESIVVGSLQLNADTNGFDVVYAERIFGGAWFINNMATGSTYYKSFGIQFPSSNWDNNNDWNSLLAGGNVVASYKISDVTKIKPGSTIDLTIQTSHTDPSNLVSANSLHLWGSGFLMSNALNFSPTTWSGGKCIKAQDIIFCPYDQIAYIEASGSLTGSFIVPTKWGGGTVLSDFKYAFSNNVGNMVAFQNEIQLTQNDAFITSCTVTDWVPIYPNSKVQEQSITFKTTLNYKFTLNQVFYVILELSALPNGLSIDSFCNYFNRNLFITCSVISSGNIIKFKSQIIDTDDNSDYYLIQDSMQIVFYVSHSGLDTDVQSFQARLTINTDTNIVEQCATDGALSFSDQTLLKNLLLLDFKLENQYQNSKSGMQMRFQINNRVNLQFHQCMQLQLGFMASTNLQLLSAQNHRCLFYNDDGSLNHHWNSLKYDSSNKQLVFELKTLYYSSVQLYQIKCTNIRNPDGTNTEDLILIWAYYDASIDNKYTGLQSANIEYSTLNFISEKTYTTIPKLVKLLNVAGVGAYYQFQFTPSRTNMTYGDQIYIELSAGQVVRPQHLFCSINEVNVDCTMNKRRIILLPQQQFYSRMNPNKLYNISIGPIIQPKSLDGFGKIWIGSLLANNKDVFSEQSYIIDIPIQTTLPGLLPYASVQFSQYISRINKVYLKVNFTAPIRTINFDKCIVIQLGEEFRVPQKRVSNLTIECRLYRLNDNSKVNFTSSCIFMREELIKINLIYDPVNSRQQQQYQLEIRSLITPDLVSLNNLQQYFPFEVQFFITDLNMQTINYIAPPCIQYLPNPLVFKQQENQQQFQWYIYNKQENSYEKLIPLIGQTQYPTFTIYKGVVEQDIYLFLGLNTQQTQFDRQVNISITQNIINIFGTNEVVSNIYKYNNLGINYIQLVDPNLEEDATKETYQITKLLTNTMTIEIGDYGYYFHISSKQDIGSGIYYLNFDREITDKRTTKKETISVEGYSIIDYYSIIPTIALQIDTQKQCHIFVSISSDKIPLEGKSQPIYFQTTCIPTSELYIQPIVKDPIITPAPIIMSIKQLQQFYSGNPREQLNYYMQLEASSKGSIGDEISVTFQLTGQEANVFSIDTISLLVIKNSNAEELVVNSSIDANSTQITVNCTMDGQLLWSICPKSTLTNTFNIQKNRQMVIADYSIDVNLYKFRLYQYLNPLNQYLQYYKQKESTVEPTYQSSLYSRQILYGIIGEDKVNYMSSILKNSNKVIKLNKVEQDMQIQIACKNQYGKISSIKTHDLSKSNNIITRNHSLVILQFSRQISINQVNNLMCSIKELLLFNIHHVTDVQCQICNPNLLYYNKKSWSDVLSLNESYEGIVNTTLVESDSNINYYFYLNNYLTSQNIDVIAKTYQFINKLANDTTAIQQLAKKITNTTADPEISYLLRFITIVNYTEASYSAAQNQITLTANMTQNFININITNNNKNTLVFIGIQKFISQLDFSSPINLRRGITGNGIKLEQFALLQNAESTYQFSVQPYNSTSFKYFLQWSSSPIQANCLSQQYQDTQLLILEYNQPEQSYAPLISILIFIACILQ
ncbi:unnamed protein product [Paramecium octaurelia]|uniref:Uncharacterized protein n=1 Tax=Paramecium octaurelia TaxID=43137 RepID=A0A8S1T6C0_PAROT|nr:unnamed protein product [Paramecium octaurelia]